ncbi:hypothetical protein PHYPSEUDO_007909 [Phytophthora pseudosyringae]|uniref:Uncharacterized protein n=1 Tax=Phytophthora pseudosyringae TaxID=221518 RepID=A0A8T1VFL6_9STRA|nr:hypothetical protein PHYPSEUDO_007909 [Phytophthora pseudosyringae]
MAFAIAQAIMQPADSSSESYVPEEEAYKQNTDGGDDYDDDYDDDGTPLMLAQQEASAELADLPDVGVLRHITELYRIRRTPVHHSTKPYWIKLRMHVKRSMA